MTYLFWKEKKSFDFLSYLFYFFAFFYYFCGGGLVGSKTGSINPLKSFLKQVNMQTELFLLIVSLLFFLSILSGRASSRLGIPALLFFLAVGMLFGSDGFGIRFENIQLAQSIGTIALCMILFSGGLDTQLSEVKPVMYQGILLATVGVFLTAILSGLLTWWILKLTLPAVTVSLITAFLLASIMSSTDSASVFSILRSRGLALRNNLRPLLELESGSNDPMAYVLVITLIDIIKMGSSPNYWNAGLMLVLQLLIGMLLGYFLGKLSVFLINKVRIYNDSLYPILVFTFAIFIFSVTYFLKGNGFLAVYVAGLVIGNSKFIHKRSTMTFFDGLAWLFQLTMFLMLGLLVNPHELVDIIVPGLIISLSTILITRPVAVALTLLPFKKMPVRDKAYVSLVGLRGAVPIIFAIIPLAENIPHARLIFNIVFFCTLVSLLVQGTSISVMAKWFGVIDYDSKESKMKKIDIDFASELKTVASEVTITQSALRNGSYLMNLSLPDQTLAVLLKRGDNYCVPTGKTELQEGDVLLMITDDKEALLKTYENLGVEYKKLKFN